MGRLKNLEGTMKRFYKIIASTFLMVVIFSGCEKKEEEVHPTETTTTIIEVDKDDESNVDTGTDTQLDTEDESTEEENKENNN